MPNRVLLVDVGNSRLKWGWAEAGQIVENGACPTGAVMVGGLDSQWSGRSAPDAVYISNVAGADIATQLEAWVAERWRLGVCFARSEARACGVTNGYERPEQLGVDRWVALIAARRNYPLPVCVVDVGTALTLDVIDTAGQHLGGLIAPGPVLMKRALHLETRGIEVADSDFQGWLGRSTAEGLAGGIHRACAGLVENVHRETVDKLGQSPTLIICGGAGESIAQLLTIPYRLDPLLVLRGLLTLADIGS